MRSLRGRVNPGPAPSYKILQLPLLSRILPFGFTKGQISQIWHFLIALGLEILGLAFWHFLALLGEFRLED